MREKERAKLIIYFLNQHDSANLKLKDIVSTIFFVQTRDLWGSEENQNWGKIFLKMISRLKIELQIDDGVHIEDDMGWYSNPYNS